MSKRIIEVEERLPLLPTIPLSLQHLFAMFGSTVLVPFLLHVDPATCLFMNGIGTLLYLTICKWKLPAYLGSSFAFISPVLAVTAAGDHQDPAWACRKLFEQFGSEHKQFINLGREQGFSDNFGHVEMLVSKAAQAEVWPLVARWLNDQQTPLLAQATDLAAAV